MRVVWCGLPGYIDLSKRRVLPEDVEKCEERYNQAKAVSGRDWRGSGARLTRQGHS